jgi:hypothetical protein
MTKTEDQMQFKFVFLLYCAAALTPCAAIAQQSLKPDAADPNVAVPALIYESAFTGYAPYRDVKVAPWRDVNDEVARAGGHIGIVGGAGGRPAHGAATPAPHPPAQGVK